MKKLKNRVITSLFSLIMLGGSLPTAFASPDIREETITQFEKSYKPPRRPYEETRETTYGLSTDYNSPMEYYRTLINYEVKLVNWRLKCNGNILPEGSVRCRNDIEDLTGAHGYVRYMLRKTPVRNKFKNIEKEIRNLKSNTPKFLEGQFLNRIRGSIYNLDGFILSKSLRNIVNDLMNNLNGVKSVKDKDGIIISEVILNFSREKCKSVEDYIKIFTSDDIPEFIPPIICVLKSKFHEAIGEEDLIKIGRNLHRVLFRTMIYRLCMGEI